MSKEIIKEVLSSLSNSENKSWRLSLLKFHTSKTKGTTYFVRDIEINPYSSFTDYLKDVSDTYLGDKVSKLNTYQRICNYDGSNVGDFIYKLKIAELELNDLFDSLINAINNPDKEDNIDEKFNAYVISGEMLCSGKTHKVIIITVKNPLIVLKHKFGYENGVFKKNKAITLSLNTFFDILIIDNDVYLFNLSGEKLFDLERTYRQICDNVSNEICAMNLFTDANCYKELASKGHNPRRFLSFNQSKLDYVKKSSNLSEIAEQFGISLKDGKVDTSDEKNVDKFVKYLCDKGMVDPVDKTPREVSSAHEWK